MKKVTLFLVLVIFLSSNISHAVDSDAFYLCKGESSVGFNNHGGNYWKETIFKAETKFLYYVNKIKGIHVLEKRKGNIWVVVSSSKEFKSQNSLVEMNLGIPSSDFMLNKKTMRFIYSNAGSYLLDLKNKSAYIEVGTCRIVSRSEVNI